MNSETVFRAITAILLLSALTISIYFRHKADQRGGQLDKSQGQGLLIGLRLLALVVLLPLLGYIINPSWVTWARFALPDWSRWMAAICAVAMIPAIYWLFSSIQDNISPTQATRRGHQLVTHGPYRWIRHPLYTFGTIFFLALALLSGVWWLGVGMLVSFAILFWRTGHEEANLLKRFGDEYRSYMQRTGRYLPRWNRIA